ncbi:MAG TPA: hypothetical protein VFX98_10010 [Longimicrobiaceae bacterium]|nr:hypothetical protein [Longimicrobiaceae bacterium]
MSKLFPLLLLLVAVVVIYRPARERVRPHLQFAFDPFYEWSTRNRVKELRDLLVRQEQLGKQIPAPRDFPAFVEAEDVQHNASLDPWGTPYYLRSTRTTYRVGSAGKDRQVGTTDDILGEEQRRVNPPRR